MASNLQGIEITDSDTTVYNFEIFKSGDNKARGVSIASKEWEIGDPQIYWKQPLFPFDGGLHQDRLPDVANITTQETHLRTYSKANIDASNEGTLVPPPINSSLSLSNGAIAIGPPVIFNSKEFFNCGRYIYTVSRDDTVTLDKDFGSGKAAVSMVVFNNELIVGMGESEKIWKRDTSATWTQATDSTYAIALGVVGNKLWRAESTNKLSNCITTPLTLANWTPASPNQYYCGDTTYAVHTIINYGGVPWVLKADGAYAPDAKGDFYNQAPQIANWPHTDNGKGAFTAQGYLWVPSIIGLIRVTAGQSLIRGPERSNRPDFRFWVRGGVEWGESIYLLVTDETQTSESFICKMSVDKYGLTKGQEYIYHEWCRLGTVDKGYSIGINTWPSGTTSSITRDAGTIADLAGVGTITWSNPTNAVSSNNVYATAAAGTSHYLRFSNFGFAFASTDTLLGYIVTVERKGSSGSSNSTKNPSNAVSLSGVGSIGWTIAGTQGTAVGLSASTASTVYLVWTNFGFALPTDATVLGIEISITSTATDTGRDNPIVDNVVKLYLGEVTGTNKSTGAHRDSTSATTITYGSSTDLWGTTPSYSDINNSAFGVALSITFQQCSWTVVTGTVSIKVYYTASGVVDNVVKLVDASATVVGTNKADTSTSWPNADANKEYGGAGDVWGNSFTYSDANDTDFGFVLSATVPATLTASVDYASMTVFYQSATIVAPPALFVGHGATIKKITLGYGSGRDIDDPNYPFETSMELETGLFQPTQDVTLVSGLIGVSMVGKVRTNDSITLQYALGADTSYSNLLDTQEGGGTAAITSSGTYSQFTRYAPPNTTGPYFRIKLSGTLAVGAGTDRCEIRNLWAFGYIRPKVTDLIKVPIYCDRYELNNGIPQGRTGGDTLRLFRNWLESQTVFTLRFPDYEESRTIRARVFSVDVEEAISDKATSGISREVLIANIVFVRDDFAGVYADA